MRDIIVEERVLKNTLEQLRKFQEILNQKFEVEKQLQELPKEIERRDEIVIRMKENFLEFNDKRNALKKEIIVKRDELDKVVEKTSKLEKEVGNVSSQRDYEQIDRAIKDNNESEQTLRREIQVAEKKIHDFQEEFTNAETLLQEQEHSLMNIKDKIEQDIIKYEVQLKELEAKKQEVTMYMEDNLVFKFERILKSREGDGIVPIRQNVCYGCHMLLPLKIVNEVCEEQRVVTCPYCSKILFYDGDSDKEEVENIEIAGLKDIIDTQDISLDDFDEEDYHSFMQKDDLGSDEYIPAQNLEEMEDDIEDDLDDDDIEDELGDDIEDEDLGDE